MPEGRNQLYTDEDCVEALWRVARMIDRPPDRGKYTFERRATDPAATTVANRIGNRTWDGALEAAGLADWDGTDDGDGPTNAAGE